MGLAIKEINDKKVWEDFLQNQSEKTFLQSWNWGQFCQSLGEKIWRWGIFDNEKLLALALTELKKTRRGTFLLVPHGPICAKTSAGETARILEALTEKLKVLAPEEKASFIRINPIWERNEENNNLFQKLEFRKAPLQIHPEASWKLDITPPEETLLSQMRKTTRYLIRQCQKDPSVKILTSQKQADVEAFGQYHQRVSQRQQFVPFSLEYLEKEFSAFAADDAVELFFGYYGGEIAAGAFVIFWSGIGFYHHAISVPKFSKYSIPYLLQWEAIKEAKRRNCRLYDFWGFIDPQKQPRHPWAGPTLFKMGFGGSSFRYVQTQDLMLSSKYWLTYLFEKMRRWKRRL